MTGFLACTWSTYNTFLDYFPNTYFSASNSELKCVVFYIYEHLKNNNNNNAARAFCFVLFFSVRIIFSNHSKALIFYFNSRDVCKKEKREDFS